jgi:L-seryl-tRNA(Ser) seleniumtransferase
LIAELTRQRLDQLRFDLSKGKELPDLEAIAQSIALQAERLLKPGLARLINATGVILNTNLGRAPLAESVLKHICEVASGYCNLEFDLDSGKRGERSRQIEALLRILTGCEAALVVNNNAAAVLLVVSTFARDREVIVSRGELIEIGGSFRLPDVIRAAGGNLKEVGTTNRTRLSDFRQAITPNTGLLLRCHRSNFEIVGFTQEVALEELVLLSAESGIPVLEDLGSGALIDLGQLGFAGEPTVQSQLKAGADLVSFSGDKLLGGPQAGIIVGKRPAIERLHKSPLYRALRPDKLTLAALEILLAHYLSPSVEKLVPTVEMASSKASELRARAEAFASKADLCLKHIACAAVATTSAAGGGSLPGKTFSSYGVALDSKVQPNQLAAMLRRNQPPVVAIVKEEQVILDLLTVFQPDEETLLAALIAIDSQLSASH